MLDLAQFSSREDAFAKAEPAKRYVDIGSVLLPMGEGDGLPMTLPVMFWLSMIARAQGLHSAISREIRAENPHAVYPLIRAYAEAVVLVIYVLDHPHYVDLLTRRPSELPTNGQKRKGMQALINYASKHAAGMKHVYAELSEATHFGAIAMWASHKIVGEDDSGFHTTWSSHPGWDSDEQAMVPVAQLLELAEGMDYFLREFARRHVLPLRVLRGDEGGDTSSQG